MSLLNGNGELMIYALNENGILVHVDSVPNGNACGCKCPSCGKPLTARQGLKKRHSFAHQSNLEKCVFGYQTSLHLLAKEIINEGCKIKLPPVRYGSDTKPIDNSDYDEICSPIFKSMILEADEVFLEKRVDDFIPDIVVKKGNRQLFIEIYVTHPVDDDKKKRIERTGISTIEFDLTKVDRDISKEYLREILETGSSCHWIYNIHSVNKTFEFNKKMEQKRKIIEEKEKRDAILKEKRKQEYIERYGSNKRYYKIYGPFDEPYIFNPPCRNAELYNGKRIKRIGGCHMCPYFLSYEDGVLWCQRKRFDGKNYEV